MNTPALALYVVPAGWDITCDSAEDGHGTDHGSLEAARACAYAQSLVMAPARDVTKRFRWFRDNDGFWHIVSEWGPEYSFGWGNVLARVPRCEYGNEDEGHPVVRFPHEADLADSAPAPDEICSRCLVRSDATPLNAYRDMR